MAEKILVSGNEAICRGAIQAGCKLYAGYPITPQNDIPEFMSREMPRAGGSFVQTEDELAAINIVYGASQAGGRAMTSTSGPGVSLMLETISNISLTEHPAVVVDVMRLGPGQGTIQSGQTDYRQATKGGGHGGYRCIVLAPSSPQDCFDMTQLAFHLADKYRMVVTVLSDFIIGRMAEIVELKSHDFGPLPEKDWALWGTDAKGGKRAIAMSGLRLVVVLENTSIPEYFERVRKKYARIAEEETRWRSFEVDDADITIVAFGSTARVARRAVRLAREEGIKAGLIEPQTLWPFPEKAIKQAAARSGKILVVEDSMGQMVEDVQCTVMGKVPVHLLGIWGRHEGGPEGIIHPERVLEELRSLA